jgi:hypothetical protein
MRLNGRTTALPALMLLLCLTTSIGASASLAAEMERQPTLVKTSTDTASRPIFQADVPPVRPLLMDELCGAEPDPEGFDQSGLEQWWQRHQQTIEREIARRVSNARTASE